MRPAWRALSSPSAHVGVTEVQQQQKHSCLWEISLQHGARALETDFTLAPKATGRPANCCPCRPHSLLVWRGGGWGGSQRTTCLLWWHCCGGRDSAREGTPYEERLWPFVIGHGSFPCYFIIIRQHSGHLSWRSTWHYKGHLKTAGGPVVKNLPSNAGDTGSIPGQRIKIPHATGQLSPNGRNWDPTQTNNIKVHQFPFSWDPATRLAA